MADETLQFDVEFNATSSASAAEQLIQNLADKVAGVGEAFSDAVAAAMDLAAALGTGAGAAAQIEAVDLSGLGDASAALDAAAEPAGRIADSLTTAGDAAVAAAASADDIDSLLTNAAGGATEMSTGLTDAAASAAAVVASADDIDTLLAGAVDGTTALAAGVTDSADSWAQITAAIDQSSSSLDGAAASTDAVASAAAEAAAQAEAGAAAAEGQAAAQEKVQDSTKKTTASQKESSTETAKSVDLAGRLSAEFEKIQGKAGGLVGPMARFTDEALKAVAALEGISGIATGGLAAGAVGLLAAGASFKSASDTITLATGATGEALHGLQDDFATALQGSGRSAGDLAQILAGLNRDTGATGDALAKATDQTAKFLKVTNGSATDVRGLAQAMLALGVGADGLAGFEDQLATVTTHFGISLSSLVQQIKTAGPALATFGFDPGQVAGLIGELDQAGLSITRLVPGFTKLATTASADGKTAAAALTDLISRIKGAGNAQAALNEVQGVFSGRVAASFVNAVRNGTVDIGKLNAIMAESPGTVNRLGEAVKGLSGQFGGIKNDILAAFGQTSLPLLEGLRQGVQDVRPFLRDLFQVLGDLAPLFKGFAAAAFLPVDALRLLGPPLELIDAVLSRIPAPLLEAVGAMAAFKLLPFGFITQGLAAMGQGLIGLVNAAEVATVEGGVVGALGGALGAINPVALAATAGIAAFAFVLHDRANQAREMRDKVDALNKSIGDLAFTSAEAAPKIEELLGQGSKGKLISDDQRAAIADVGLSLSDFRALLQQTAEDPNQDITKHVRESVLAAAGGIQGLIDQNLTGKLRENATAAAATADGNKRLTDSFLSVGLVAGQHVFALDKATTATKEITQAEQDQAAAQIQDLLLKGKVKQSDIDAAVSSLQLKSAKDNEAAVYVKLADQVNTARLSKEGLLTVDAAENEKRGGILDNLEKEGALHDQVAETVGQHAAVLNALTDAGRSGIPTDEQRIGIIEKTGASEKDLAKAEQELADLQAKHTPVTQAFSDALRNTFEQIGHGTGEWQALSGAARAFNVDVTQLEPAFEQLNSQLQKFAPPVKAGDDVMGQLLNDMREGLPIQTTFKDLLEVSGGNAEVAFAALDEYKQGVDDTKEALDKLVPSLGSVLDKLEEAGKINLTAGRDAAAEQQAIADTSQARHDDVQAQIDDLNAEKQARQDAAQASVDAQKDALQDEKQARQDFVQGAVDVEKEALQQQKKNAEAAAKAAGAAFDPTAIDLQIKGLKARADTDDLDAQLKGLKSRVDTGDIDAQIKELEGRQKAIDEDTARAQEALAVFDQEEKAIRANEELRFADLNKQLTDLQTARQIAVDTAAAQGKAFDTTTFDKKIADVQAQREALLNGTNQAIADAQASSGRVQEAVTEAQGGLLDFGAVLDTFQAQMTTKINNASTIAELQAQGFGDIVRFLFDPNAGISDSERGQRLAAIATLSPDERAAFEERAKKALAAEEAATKAQGDLGDIFAKPNQPAVDHANDRGKALAAGLADGFVQSLDDSKINEIIDLVIKTGVDPTAARKFVTDQVEASRRAAGIGVTPSAGLAGVGISSEQVDAARESFGLAGTAVGTDFVAAAGQAMKDNPLNADVAAVMLQPVQDELPRQGAVGGTTVAFEVDKAIKSSPIPPDAAVALAEGLRGQLPVEGQLGGGDYAAGVVVGIAANPVPTEAGTIMVATVGQALSVAGTDAGANYALGVAAGIAAKQGDATQAAYLAAQSVDAAGHASLEVASPSKKGIRLGGFWIDGLIKGINDKLPDLDAATLAITELFTGAFDGNRIDLSGSAFAGLEQGDAGLTAFRDKLIAAGWAGHPDDMVEALYPPAGFTAAEARLSIAGTEAGSNYAASVAAGIAARQGDAATAALLAAQGVDDAAHAGLEASSPSKKGLRLGGFWIDGIVAGITGNLDKVKAAASQVSVAVSAPLRSPALVGAGVGAGAAGGDVARFSGANGGSTSVHIENVNVTGTTNASGDDVATALSRKIGWLGITGRAEL